MTTFIQLHLLTAYGPANLNRDDSGRPKTAMMGGVERLRISSQSLKRAWRTSEVFAEGLSEHMGKRTRRVGVHVYEKLLTADWKQPDAEKLAGSIASQFGKLKNDKNALPEAKLVVEQLVHISPEELAGIDALTDTLIAEARPTATPEELQALRARGRAVDIALFGRMLADWPEHNVEAACQVSHALGVDGVTIEDDFFTAVDDLNTRADSGSAHMGDQAFASALFYTYICISRDLLLENLNNDQALVDQTLNALVETVATVSPSGKQNSFASRARASYVLAEVSNSQPRSLVAAFFNPLCGENQLEKAIERLQQHRTGFERMYGDKTPSCEISVMDGERTLSDLLQFIAQNR